MSRREKIWLGLLVLVAMSLLGVGLWLHEETDRADLRYAVRRGTYEDVKAALARGVDVNLRTERGGCSLLFQAVLLRKSDVARLLLDAGADPAITCFNERLPNHEYRQSTPLHMAVYRNPELIPDLLAHGAPVNARDADEKTPLADAPRLSLEEVKLLLEHGADVNAVDTSGRTPLHYVISSGNVSMARLLVSHGAKIPDSSPDPIAFAVRSGELAMVKYVLDLGYPIEQASPRIVSQREENIDILLYLLDVGFDPNETDEAGRNALFFAWSPKVLSMLLDRGGDATVVDNEGNTLLHQPHGRKWERQVALLLEHGADATAANLEGNTPLHTAAEWKNTTMARLLIEHGADPDVANNSGARPADLVPYSAYTGRSRSGFSGPWRSFVRPEGAELMKLLGRPVAPPLDAVEGDVRFGGLR